MDYRTAHDELHLTISTAIAEFKKRTGGEVTRVYVHGGVCELTTTINPERSPTEVRKQLIQRRLDDLDEEIDTLQREKQSADHRDESGINKALAIQQKAREHLGAGDLKLAEYGSLYAQICLQGERHEFDNYQANAAMIERFLNDVWNRQAPEKSKGE